MEFEDDALLGIVRRAKARKTGARGLRGVLEEVMNPIMYDLPDQPDVRVCRITGSVVNAGSDPIIETESDQAEQLAPRTRTGA